MGRFRIAIIIPAFNEESTLLGVIQSVQEYGDVIVVNDASTDKTKQIAEDSDAILVNHGKNKGYDAALNSGCAKARELNYNVVITFDADGQHNRKHIQEYIDLLEQGFEVIVGIRSKFQRVAEYIFAWAASWRWGVKDPLCGMKAYRIDVYNQLGYFDSYNSIGTELAIYAAHKKLKIAQQFIKVEDRKDRPRFGSGFSANMAILRALWRGYKKY